MDMFGSIPVDASSPPTSTPSVRLKSHMSPASSFSTQSSIPSERRIGGGVSVFSDNAMKQKSTNKTESTMATLFGTMEDTPKVPSYSHHGNNRASTWSTVTSSIVSHGSNHSSKVSLSSTATSTPTRTPTSATGKLRTRDNITSRATPQIHSNYGEVSHSHINSMQQTMSTASSSSSSLPISSSSLKIQTNSSDDMEDEREKENTVHRNQQINPSSSSLSSVSPVSSVLKKDRSSPSSIVHFEVLCLFSSTLACGMTSTSITRPPVLETTLTAYVENFRNFDSYNHSDMVSNKGKSDHGKSGARFLLDVEAVVRNSSFAVQDVLRFLCIQPHQLVLCKRVLNGEDLRHDEDDNVDEIYKDLDYGNMRQVVNMNEFNSVIEASSCLGTLIHKQKGNKETLSSSEAYVTTRSVVTTRIGNPEVFIDTTASTILKSAFKWLRKKLHNNSRSYEKDGNDRRSMVVLPSPLSYASRGALLSAWASHGPNIASTKSSAAALAATYAKSHDGQTTLYKHSGKMNIVITEMGELYTSVSLVMLEMPIGHQNGASIPIDNHDNMTHDDEKSVTITILSTSGTMNYGIKDAEAHLLQTWLAGCSDKELFNDAILALNSYRYCPQPSEYIPSGEGGSIQCGNDWLSPIEDLERKAQERSLVANEERMLSLRATARATIEAHALRGNITTAQHYTYTTPSLQRGKNATIQEQRQSLEHNRRHANQRSFHDFLFSPQGLLCQYLPCSPEHQKLHTKQPRRDRSSSETGNSTIATANDSKNNYGAWHENGGPTIDIPKRLHFYGLGEVVRGCVQSCLSPSRMLHASKVGDVLPINPNNDDDVNEMGANGSKIEEKVEEVIRKPHPPIVDSLLWVEGGAGVYKHCLTSLVKKEIEAQLGFIEAFRQEEESFERRRKVRLERREKALRQLEREKTSATTTVSGSTMPSIQPIPLPRLPSITKPSMSIVQRWGYVLPTIISNPLFRGGMTVGTRYGFAMDGDDVLTEAELEGSVQPRKTEVIREYEFEYLRDKRPTVLLNHDDAWNGAVLLIKDAAKMRVYDVSPATVGMVIVCVVGVGKRDNIDWVKDEILLVKGVHEYIHWLVEDEKVDELMLSLELSSSNTISMSNPLTDTFITKLPICPVRISHDKRGSTTPHSISNKTSTLKGRYICITLQKNSFDNLLPFECKYEHRSYIDYEHSTSSHKDVLSVNTEVVGMVELTLSSSPLSSSADILTSPLRTSISHLSPIKSKHNKETASARTNSDHSMYDKRDSKDDDDDDDESLMSLVVFEIPNADVDTPSTQPEMPHIALPTFKNCVICISVDEGLLAMTYASSLQALIKFQNRGEVSTENVENQMISSPMLQSFHNLAERVYQALTPLSAFIMPSAKRDTDISGIDLRRHRRYLDVPRTSLVGEFDASTTPPPPPSTPVRKSPDRDKNATKKFSIGGRFLGQQFRRLHPFLRLFLMLVSVVTVTVVAFMFIWSSSTRLSLDSAYRTKLSIKSAPVLVTPTSGVHDEGNIIAPRISDTSKPPLNFNVKTKRSTKASKGRNVVTKGSRKSGVSKPQRNLPKEKSSIHPAGVWVKKKVNGIMDVMIDKLHSMKSNIG